MIELLSFKQQIAQLLKDAGVLGTWTFAGGGVADAIAILPDPDYKMNFPPTGTQLTGLQCMVLSPDNPSKLTPMLDSYLVVEEVSVLIAQSDGTKNTREAQDILLAGLTDYFCTKIVVVPPQEASHIIESARLVFSSLRGIG